MARNNNALIIGGLVLGSLFLFRDQIGGLFRGPQQALSGAGSGISDAFTGLGSGINQIGQGIGSPFQSLDTGFDLVTAQLTSEIMKESARRDLEINQAIAQAQGRLQRELTDQAQANERNRLIENSKTALVEDITERTSNLPSFGNLIGNVASFLPQIGPLAPISMAGRLFTSFSNNNRFGSSESQPSTDIVQATRESLAVNDSNVKEKVKRTGASGSNRRYSFNDIGFTVEPQIVAEEEQRRQQSLSRTAIRNIFTRPFGF
jgi:hypothetical protein